MRVFGVILYLALGLCFYASEPPDLVFYDLDDVPRRPLQPSNEKLGPVLLFYWHDCPVCNSYAPEIARIYNSYTNFSFFIVQVDPELTRPIAKTHASEYGLKAPVLLDSQHQLVKWAKASSTPEAVIVGSNSVIQYQGRIDNLYADLGKKRSAATQHDLREALEAISKKRPIKTKKTKAVGCLIQESK
jgi:peroxiredoxin